MATFLEPPGLLSVAVVLAAGIGALYYGLRPALRGPLPAATSERDEVWGVEDPPPPPKRRYVYPADRPLPESPEAAPESEAETRREADPEPFAQMPPGPGVAPVRGIPQISSAPLSAVPARVGPPSVVVVQPPEPLQQIYHAEPGGVDGDEDDDEVSLADLFRPRRRPPPRPKPNAAPDDAPTQD